MNKTQPLMDSKKNSTFLYAPGCALMAYKPRLAEKLKTVLEDIYGPMDTLLTCCFNTPELASGTCILTPCTTCCNRYRTLYQDCTVSFVLETLAGSRTFPFPDYGGIEMSIQDSCAGRTDDRYLQSVRKMLGRMNIHIIEAEKSGRTGKCCGESLFGKVPIEKVEAFMKKRAAEMPMTDVVVYCASCIQGMLIGGKRPRYLLDLLFGEPTEIEAGVTAWNKRLLEFRNSH